MKKLLTLLLSGLTILLFNGIGFAGIYEFSPFYQYHDYDGDYNDLNDLNHCYAYSWEIDMTEKDYAPDEVITSMELTLSNIQNYNNEDNTLFLSVLDSPGTSSNGNILDWSGNWELYNNDVDSYYDGYYGMSNYFTNNTLNSPGNAKELLSIENMDNIPDEIKISFDMTINEVTIIGKDVSTTTVVSSSAVEDLFAWAQDGVFELGFDPDCHFYNDGISLKVFTSDTPGGASHAPEPETMVLFGLGLLGFSALGRKRYNSMG